MGVGLHSLNSVSPKVTRKIWATYVLPRLTYGLECLCLISTTEKRKLEDFYGLNLRAIQHFPKATANAAIYLLLGTPPLEVQLHIKSLTLYMGMLRHPGSVEAAIINRQICMKSVDNNTWVTDMQRLLERYDLLKTEQLVCSLPSKSIWKHLVREWETQLKKEAFLIST